MPLQLVSDSHASSKARPDEKSAAYKAAVAVCGDRLRAFQPLLLNSLPQPVQEALTWMRRRADEAIERDKSLAPSYEMGHDLRLLRFLIGTKWDMGKASEEYVSALKQRRDLKIDALRDRIVAANARFFQEGGTALDEIHFHPSSEAVSRKLPRLFTVPRSAGSGDDASDGHSNGQGGSGGAHSLLVHKGGHMLVVDHAPDFAHISALGETQWHEVEVAFTELQMLILDELSARSGQLVMVARITDVLNRETALASSLNPVNPWASKGEKQFKATGMTRVALPCLLSRPRPRARTSQRLLVDAVRVSIHLTPLDARQPWFASSPRRTLPPCPQAP